MLLFTDNVFSNLIFFRYGGTFQVFLELNGRRATILADCEQLHHFSFPKYGLTMAQRFFRWLTRKNPVEVWLDVLRDAKAYDEWEEAAFQLDVLLGNDLW